MPSEPFYKKLNTRGNFVARKRTITVWTVSENEGGWKIYHCPDCRNPVAQYKGDLVAEVPGGVPDEYPVLIQCKNSNCGRKIMFKSSTKQAEV